MKLRRRTVISTLSKSYSAGSKISDTLANQAEEATKLGSDVKIVEALKTPRLKPKQFLIIGDDTEYQHEGVQNFKLPFEAPDSQEEKEKQYQ